ncbi:hypothetical protein [Streptomyces formicae]|nr:hypothetical protein [Streptomyces formicae]
MTEIFSGAECSVFQSGIADHWMVVSRTGAWVRLRLDDLADISRGVVPRSPAGAFPYRLPADPHGKVDEYTFTELLAFMGVADRYPSLNDMMDIEYEFIDYYPPKRLLEYSVRAPLHIPAEASAFLARHAESYTPVSFEEDA